MVAHITWQSWLRHKAGYPSTLLGNTWPRTESWKDHPRLCMRNHPHAYSVTFVQSYHSRAMLVTPVRHALVLVLVQHAGSGALMPLRSAGQPIHRIDRNEQSQTAFFKVSQQDFPFRDNMRQPRLIYVRRKRCNISRIHVTLYDLYFQY